MIKSLHEFNLSAGIEKISFRIDFLLSAAPFRLHLGLIFAEPACRFKSGYDIPGNRHTESQFLSIFMPKP
jgi:hypothetical protein